MVYMYTYYIYMLIMFLFMFMIGSILYYMKLGLIFEWLVYSFNSINIEYMILMDWISCLFMSVVFLISSMIMLYSMSYMMGEKFILRFIFLVILFVVSMILMIISPNIISILLGWDGLGVTSYCLVIYYQNYMSFNSGMLTVLVNRMGDIGLLMSISLMMMFGSWNMWFMEKSMKILMIMVCIAGMTKSAQIPFSSWLPSAMAAPTPVSALVHSSTLVTAGVYLVIRLNKYLMDSGVSMYLLFFSVLTMFMSGLMANFELDLKKIIALSTLSQLGLMMMILSMGLSDLSFYHLLTHALFKSLLFMCAGIMIHVMSDNQDIRFFGSLNNLMPFTMMSFYISLMSLCGFPFMSGFYSKDFIMEMVYLMENNMILFVLIVISLMFTISYSLRLFYYMFFKEVKFSFMSISEDKVMNLSMMMLVISSIICGSLFNWMYFFDNINPYMSVKLKMVTMFMCVMGVMFFFLINSISVMKIYSLSYYFSSMWFMNYMYLWIYSPVMVSSSKFYEFEKGWLEKLKNFMFIEFIYSFMNFMFHYKFKMYLFMYLYMMLLLLIYLLK